MYAAERADSVAFFNKEPLFLGVNGAKPNMNGKPWEGNVPAWCCWMCSLSWGVQFRFPLLDAVKADDVFLMSLSTCSFFPFGNNQTKSHCKC